MSTSALKPNAKRVTFDSEYMWVELIDGRKIGVPLAYFPRLAAATAAQRKRYVISGGGVGLHWAAIDEDISVPALLNGKIDRTVKSAKTAKHAA